ncbi:MAG: NAD(P)/FAD-dependent oxidoreductase [Alphaproteobacteria bacterium]
MGDPVTIIGAGVVGMACAVALQRDGQQVHVVDGRAPGEGCSKGNAGLIAADHVLPLATPGILRQVPRMLFDPMGPLTLRLSYLPRIAPWLVRFLANATPARVERLSAALVALTRPALDDWRDLLAEIGGEPLIEQRGWLALYRTESAFLRDAGERERQRSLGVAVEELAGEALRQQEPALGDRKLARGVLFPDSAHSIDSFRLVQHLAEAVARHGGRVTRAEVTAIEAGPDGPRLLRTDAGPIPVRRLLVAAGAWSKPLARALGHRVPLDTERGYHIHLANPGVTLARPLYDAERKFFLTPMETGLRIAGTVELGGLRAGPDWRRADILLEQARTLVPGLDGGDPTRWMGFRPTLPDSLPVIGPSPAMPNAWFAFGHQHLGLTLAAVTGRMIAAMIAGRPSSIDAAPYRIDRF